MSGRKRLVVTAVGEPLEARAKAAISHFEASDGIMTGTMLMDGGGWGWRLEDADAKEAQPKVNPLPDLHLWAEGTNACGVASYHNTGSVHAATCLNCLRSRIFRERELLWHAENDKVLAEEPLEQQRNVNHLLSEGDVAPCGAEYGIGTMPECVTCPECLKWYASFLKSELARMSEARGAQRNQLQKLIGKLELVSTEASVLYFAAKMAPSESKRESKAHDRWLKAKDRTDRLREKLLALACPDPQDAGEVNAR